MIQSIQSINIQNFVSQILSSTTTTTYAISGDDVTDDNLQIKITQTQQQANLRNSLGNDFKSTVC